MYFQIDENCLSVKDETNMAHRHGYYRRHNHGQRHRHRHRYRHYH